MNTALVTRATPDWAVGARALLPGAHVALLADDVAAAVEGRLLGLELRDSLLVLRAGPTSGFVFLFRVPVAGTIASQVAATGTGGINIDGCRIPSGGEHYRATVKGRGGGMLAEDPREGAALGMFHPDSTFEPTNHLGGRWPPNVLIVHSPGCRRVGTRAIESGKAHRSHSGGKNFGSDVPKPPLPDMTYADERGYEQMVSWSCELGCPAPVLDAISGERTTSKPGEVYRRKDHETTSMAGSLGAPRAGVAEVAYGDTGGASRFYPQFESEAEMLVWLNRLVGAA